LGFPPLFSPLLFRGPARFSLPAISQLNIRGNIAISTDSFLVLGRPSMPYVFLCKSVPESFLVFCPKIHHNTWQPWRPLADEATGRHGGRIAKPSTSSPCQSHGRHSCGLVSSESKRLSIGGPPTQSLLLTLSTAPAMRVGLSSLFQCYWSILPRTSAPISYI